MKHLKLPFTTAIANKYYQLGLEALDDSFIKKIEKEPDLLKNGYAKVLTIERGISFLFLKYVLMLMILNECICFYPKNSPFLGIPSQSKKLLNMHHQRKI